VVHMDHIVLYDIFLIKKYSKLPSPLYFYMVHLYAYF